MKKVLIVDSNRRFLSDVQSRIILSDIEGLEIEVSSMVDNIYAETQRVKPDEVVIPSYLANTHPSWDFGVPVRSFARDNEGVLESNQNGLECYGIVRDSQELLNVIANGEPLQIRSALVTEDVPDSASAHESAAEPDAKEPDAHESELNDMNDILNTQMNDMALNQQAQQMARQMSDFNGQVEQDYVKQTALDGFDVPDEAARTTARPEPYSQPGFGQVYLGQQGVQSPYMPYPYPPYPMYDQNGNPIPPMVDDKGNPINPYYPGMQPPQGQQGGFNPYMPYPYPPYMGQQGNGQGQMGNPYVAQQQMQQTMEIQQQEQRNQYLTQDPVENKSEGKTEGAAAPPIQDKPRGFKRKRGQQKSEQSVQDILSPDGSGNQRSIEEQLRYDLGEKKEPAKVITVYSAKGGVGKTTIACELATYLSLISHGKGTFNVCVADYNIDFGDVISTLAFDPNGNNMSHWSDDIQDRVKSGESPDTITYTEKEIRGFIQTNATDGLNALIAPITNEDSMKISDVELEVMMRNLINNGGFDYVIFDTGNNTRDSSFLALEYADIILLVLTQNVATANCNVGFLNTFQKMGYSLDKVYTVINKVKSAKSVGISTQELEEAFVDQKTNRILTCVSHIKDSNDVRKSYNMAEPLVYNSAHDFTKDIGKIASFVIGDNFALSAPEKETFVKRIFGRKKR